MFFFGIIVSTAPLIGVIMGGKVGDKIS